MHNESLLYLFAALSKTGLFLRSKQIDMRYFTTILAAAAVLLFSCKDQTLTPEEQFQEDISKIKQYLSDRGLTADTTVSGIHYIITEEGSGGHPDVQSTVTVKYKGMLLDGTVFDQTTDSETATFALNGLIPGWQQAIPLLQKGGKGTFLIPSYLCYGPSSVGPIPPNSVLIFDIELIDF